MSASGPALPEVFHCLQDVTQADVLRSYTKPGESFTLLQLKDSAPPRESATESAPQPARGSPSVRFEVAPDAPTPPAQ